MKYKATGLVFTVALATLVSGCGGGTTGTGTPGSKSGETDATVSPDATVSRGAQDAANGSASKIDAASPPPGIADAAASGDAPAAAPAGPGMSGTPTWYQDIAPLVNGRCVSCHREGGIAPFKMTTYEDARPFAAAMTGAADDGRMPPWGAQETAECKPRFPWKQDLRLTDPEKSLLRRWSAAGAPKGDPAYAAPLPAPPQLDLANKNTRTTMAKSFSVSGDRDIFRCFPLPFTFPQDVWLTGVQVVAGNDKVVHHVLVWLDADKKGDGLAGATGNYACDGQPGFNAALLGAWAPGSLPVETPTGVGIPVKKGAKVVLNIHYHPAPGQTQMDTTSLDLRWTTTPTPWQGLVSLNGNFTSRNASTGDGLQPGPNDPPTGVAFAIPGGAKNHTESMQFTVPSELLVGARLWGVGTHMHYVGTDMKIEIDRSNRLGGAPTGEPARECLLETPRWDFNWQRSYSYNTSLDTMPSVRAGDIVRLRCLYDNSLDNPHVRQSLAQQGLTSPRNVGLGESTIDEMCLGIFGLAVKLP